MTTNKPRPPVESDLTPACREMIAQLARLAVRRARVPVRRAPSPLQEQETNEP
jgi:hypothetical protein